MALDGVISRSWMKLDIDRQRQTAPRWRAPLKWTWDINSIPIDQNVEDYIVGVLEIARKENLITKTDLATRFPLTYTKGGCVRARAFYWSFGRAFLDPSGKCILQGSSYLRGGDAQFLRSDFSIETVHKHVDYEEWKDLLFKGTIKEVEEFCKSNGTNPKKRRSSSVGQGLAPKRARRAIYSEDTDSMSDIAEESDTGEDTQDDEEEDETQETDEGEEEEEEEATHNIKKEEPQLISRSAFHAALQNFTISKRKDTIANLETILAGRTLKIQPLKGEIATVNQELSLPSEYKDTIANLQSDLTARNLKIQSLEEELATANMKLLLKSESLDKALTCIAKTRVKVAAMKDSFQEMEEGIGFLG